MSDLKSVKETKKILEKRRVVLAGGVLFLAGDRAPPPLSPPRGNYYAGTIMRNTHRTGNILRGA